MPLNISLQQILLHMFNFVILFAIFYLLLYKPVKKFMDGRDAYYKEMEEKAQKKLDDSTASEKLYKDRLAKAETEIGSLRDQAIKDADKLSENIVNDAKEEASRIITEAKAEAGRERSRILAGAGDEISEMVTAAAAKIVFSDTSSAYDDFLNAVEEGERNEQ